jgi:hypothetical protein
MQIVKFLLTVLVQLVLSGLCEAHAQRPSPQAVSAPAGLMIGAHTTAALGTTIRPSGQVTPFETAPGVGGGVRVGYAFTSRLMAWAGADIVKQGEESFGTSGSFALTHLEAGARYSFPVPRQRLRPYLTASIAHRALGTTAVDQVSGEKLDLGFSGTSLGAGVGIEYFLSPGVAIDGGVALSTGSLGTFKVDGRSVDLPVEGSTSARLMAGLNWYP